MVDGSDKNYFIFARDYRQDESVLANLEVRVVKQLLAKLDPNLLIVSYGSLRHLKRRFNGLLSDYREKMHSSPNVDFLDLNAFESAKELGEFVSRYFVKLDGFFNSNGPDLYSGGLKWDFSRKLYGEVLTQVTANKHAFSIPIVSVIENELDNTVVKSIAKNVGVEHGFVFSNLFFNKDDKVPVSSIDAIADIALLCLSNELRFANSEFQFNLQ